MPAAAEAARKLYDELEQSDVLAVLKEKRAAKKKATEDKGKAKAAKKRENKGDGEQQGKNR